MRLKIPGTRLYVGDMRDCDAADHDWTVIHAARSPCFTNQCGCPDPDASNYLHFEKGSHLFLNMIGGEQPLYQRKMFQAFLKFAKEQWGERPMLIHCNKGDSRAPALALLFLAKVLYKIRDTSFDDAWVDFEKLAGEPFVPHEGIELYLREHWRELGTAPAPQRGPVIPDASALLAALPKDNAAAMEVFRTQPILHFAAFTEIQNKDRKWIKPIPNTLQRRIAEAYWWCIANNVPCRLIILKPRQVGCSTFVCEIFEHHMRRKRSKVLLISDTADRAVVIWDMMKGHLDHDRFPWRSRVTKANTEVIEITFHDGEKGEMRYGTAQSENTGISGTTQGIWWTEAGRYDKSGGLDAKVVNASIVSLANGPDTLGIMESTAQGAVGIFHKMYKGAVKYQDRIARKRNENGSLLIGNGFLSVFAGWHEFPEHSLPSIEENGEYFDENLDDRERRGITLYAWTPEQIAWRRLFIKRECGGDPNLFDQEFPEDEEIAFLASGRQRFNAHTLAQMEMVATKMHPLAEVGTLTESEGKFMFTPNTDGDSWLWVSERPRIGCDYIAFIDPCTGAQAEGSPHPDAHGAGVWRAGYHEKNRWFPPKLVAMVDVPNGCRFDDEIIAEKLKRLADWYGGCMIVPEVNKSGILNELQRIGAVIYQREKMDAMYPGKKLMVAGWDTNVKTRPLLINAYANYIREYSIEDPSFEVHYMPLIQELKTMVMNNDKAEAKHGCRDDLVLGSALGLYNLSLASTNLPPYQSGGWSDNPARPVSMHGGLSPAAFS